MATTSTPARQSEYGLRNAFEGIAPPASTSAGSSSKHYDVFINHRGPDVKKTLARSMYHALNVLGLRVFLDSPELEMGDFLPETIQEAMRTASLHIAIFSKNYAQSAWCLAELAFMLQTRKKIIPVFYHVQPDDVRWAVKGKKMYADAFSDHQKKGRYTSEHLQQWKEALHTVSFYSGDIINNENDEQRVLKNVVNQVLKEMAFRGHLKHLKKIRMNANSFGESSSMRSLPEEFCLLQSLEHLELKGCTMLSSLPSRFGELTNLRHLDLDGCSNLSSLPSSFGDLTNLQHLDLNDCSNLSSLPCRFGDLTNLQRLDLSWCWELRKLPVSFKQLTLLEYLDCKGCSKLTITSENLENMTKLEYVNFSCCERLEELPRHIANQASLRELYLDGTSIREVPDNIGELTKLKILTIGSDWLTSLPTTLKDLSSLCKLEIGFCQKLQSLPDFLCRLSLLQDLILNHTAVSSLPNLMTQLINLKTLEIKSSPIRELSFGPGSCKVKEIFLARTDVSKISISEDSCPCLQSLRLNFNQHLMEVETLPTTVETIQVLGCTSLKNISGIRGLVNLQTLKILNCPELDALPSLEQTQRLNELVLGASDRSVIEPCIKTIQKWPWDVMIYTRTACDVESLENSFASLNLSLVDSIDEEKIPRIGERQLKLRVKSSSNTHAKLACFIINVLSPDGANLQIYSSHSHTKFEMQVASGKWIWMGVFTQDSHWVPPGCNTEIFLRDIWDNDGEAEEAWYNDGEVQKAWLVSGEKDRLLEAFHHIFYTSGH